MLTLIVGVSGSGKTETIYREIREAMATRQGMVLLTPEQQSHRAERELAAFCGPALSLHAEVLSFTRMCSRAALQLGGLADPIPDAGGRLLLMALAVNQLGQQLPRFGGQDRRADFLPRLMATAEEFRGAMVGPEALRALSWQAEGGAGEKLRELALLLEAWDAVTARQLGDSRDAVTRLADGIGQTTVGIGGVWVDGFTDFTPAELRVLEGFLARGTDLTVALTLGEAEEERFRVTEGTFHALGTLAERRGVELRIRRLKQPAVTPIRYLAEELEGGSARRLPEEILSAHPPVELCRMSSFAEECRWAAYRIRQLLQEDATLRFRDFAVAVPGLGERRYTVETVFREYGIPCFVEETEPIADKALVVCVLEALEAVTEGWRFGNVFRCLKSGFGGLSPEETDELENYCLTWDIRGESSWRRTGDWELNPAGYGQLRAEHRAALERINASRRRVAASLGKLADGLREEQPVRVLLRAVYDYLQDTGAAEALRRETEELERSGDRAGADANVRLWAVLMDCFSQMDGVMGGVSLSAGEFRRLLELLLRQQKAGAIPAALDTVSLGSPARLRGRKSKVLLVLGADDESLPERLNPAGVFSAEERRSLIRLGLKLGTGAAGEESRPFLELYTLLASPSQRLLMSFSGGEESRPGLPIRRAQALLGAEVKTGEQLGGAHLVATRETCLQLALGGAGVWAQAAQAALEPERLQALRSLAAQKRSPLSPEAVAGLYGAEFRLTASRAETFHHCAYLYFLQYGMGAKERKFAGFRAPESGTFIHYLLEHVCREVQATGGFAAVPEAELRRLTQKYTEAFAAEFFRPEQLQDARFRYLFRRLCRTAETIVLDTAAELAAGDFRPLDFELEFGSGREDSLPPVQLGDVRLRGTIDRVDGWTDGDRLFLCVADYKTGRKAFSLTDVWYGLGIQMLIYLFLLEEQGSARYGKPVIPAGVLYAPARDVLQGMPRGASPEEAAQKRAEALRRSGLLLADERLLQARERGFAPRFLPVKYRDGAPVGSIATASQLGELMGYVKKLLRRMGEELRRGQAEASPLFKNRESGPCLWCPYGSVCGFDREREAPRMEQSLTAEEFWEKLREEREHG